MSKNLSKSVVSFQNLAKNSAKPILSAINRTAGLVRRRILTEIPRHYTIEKKDAAKMIKVRPAVLGNLDASIHAESRLLTPYHFKYAPESQTTAKGTGWKKYHKRQKTTVLIKKKSGVQILRHAFVATIRGTKNVWYFEEGVKHTTDKIRALRSVSLPQMITSEEVQPIVYKEMQNNTEKYFMTAYNKLAEKEGFK